MNINLERGTYEVGVLDFDLDNISLADYDLYLFAAKTLHVNVWEKHTMY